MPSKMATIACSRGVRQAAMRQVISSPENGRRGWRRGRRSLSPLAASEPSHRQYALSAQRWLQAVFCALGGLRLAR